MSNLLRDELIAAIYAAHTRDEISQVQRRMEAWLMNHPDDKEVWALGEMLIMTEEAGTE